MSSMGRFQTGSASGLSAGYIMLRQDRCLLLRRIGSSGYDRAESVFYCVFRQPAEDR